MKIYEYSTIQDEIISMPGWAMVPAKKICHEKQ